MFPELACSKRSVVVCRKWETAVNIWGSEVSRELLWDQACLKSNFDTHRMIKTLSQNFRQWYTMMAWLFLRMVNLKIKMIFDYLFTIHNDIQNPHAVIFRWDTTGDVFKTLGCFPYSDSSWGLEWQKKKKNSSYSYSLIIYIK